MAAPTTIPSQMTALATSAPEHDDERALIPRTIEQTIDLATYLAKSPLMPEKLREAPSAFLVILQGSELGLSPMQAIRGIHVIDGKVSMSAELMVSLCLRRPDVCAYFRMIESSATRATYETHRIGRGGHPSPTKFTYTIEEAKTAGLVDKGKDEYARANNNWRRNPADMLRARASSKLARLVYPDLMMGLHDDADLDLEMRESDAPGTYTYAPPSPAQTTRPIVERAPVVEATASAPSPAAPSAQDRSAQEATWGSPPAAATAAASSPVVPASMTTRQELGIKIAEATDRKILTAIGQTIRKELGDKRLTEAEADELRGEFSARWQTITKGDTDAPKR